MRHFVLTDLEGVAGIDSFARTRSSGSRDPAPAMDQLAREVNACIEGIRSADPDAEITVWDGHGPGGLREEDVRGGTYVREGQPYYDLDGFDSQFFVGQHAMAGTAFAPLAHTYSSTSVEYYRLNGTFIGEFGCRALVAGRQGVPTVFLSGDDKACHEAQLFAPEIETVATKFGEGREAARHKDGDVAVREVRAGAERATRRIPEVPPLSAIEPPYGLVVRYREPHGEDLTRPDPVEAVDPYTIRVAGDSMDDLRRRFPGPL